MSPALFIPKPTPFAIPISFTADYPLETCKQLLYSGASTPTGWRALFYAPQIKFDVELVDANTYDFQAEGKVGRMTLIAQGSLNKLNEQATSITGYVDATSSFYNTLVLLFIIGIPASMLFFSDTAATIFFKLGFAVLFFGGAVILNLLIMRGEAMKFARTIEEILRRPVNQ